MAVSVLTYFQIELLKRVKFESFYFSGSNFAVFRYNLDVSRYIFSTDMSFMTDTFINFEVEGDFKDHLHYTAKPTGCGCLERKMS